MPLASARRPLRCFRHALTYLSLPLLELTLLIPGEDLEDLGVGPRASDGHVGFDKRQFRRTRPDAAFVEGLACRRQGKRLVSRARAIAERFLLVAVGVDDLLHLFALGLAQVETAKHHGPKGSWPSRAAAPHWSTRPAKPTTSAGALRLEALTTDHQTARQRHRESDGTHRQALRFSTHVILPNRPRDMAAPCSV